MMFKAVLLVAVLSSAGFVLQTTRLHVAKSEASVSDIQLQACGLRLEKLIRDLERDNAVDNLGDLDLRNVPDGWLLPSTGTTVPTPSD